MYKKKPLSHIRDINNKCYLCLCPHILNLNKSKKLKYFLRILFTGSVLLHVLIKPNMSTMQPTSFLKDGYKCLNFNNHVGLKHNYTITKIILLAMQSNITFTYTLIKQI